MMNELAILIPVLSHFEKMPAFMDTLGSYLTSNPGDMEVIVVVDQTVTAPETLLAYVKQQYPWIKFRLLQRFGAGSIRNYGAMVRFGMAYADSRYVVLVSPYSDDLSLINAMLIRIRKGVQLVQATRYASPQDARHVGWNFRLYQWIYHWGIRVFLGLDISDSTYGFKMFDRVFIQSIGVSRNGFSICPEITIKGLLAGGKVEYVSSTMQQAEGIKNFRLLKEGVGYVLIIARGFLHRLGLLWF